MQHAIPADNAVCRACPFRQSLCGACPMSAVGRQRWRLWGPSAAMLTALAALLAALWQGI